MVWVMGLCKSLLYNARIGYENTYDMREVLSLCSRKEDDALNRRINCTEIAALLVFGHEKGLVCDAHQDRHGAMPGERAERHSLAQKRALLLARQAHLAAGCELEICAQIFSRAVRSAGARMRTAPSAACACRGQAKRKRARRCAHA